MTRTDQGLLALVGLAAVWLASEATHAAAPTGGERVVIKDRMFSPMQLHTRVGTEVTWINQDVQPHTVVSDSGLFRSAALDTGKAYTFRFDRPGTYRVFCLMHPRMHVTIMVR